MPSCSAAAAVLRLPKSRRGFALTLTGRGDLCAIDPYAGTQSALAFGAYAYELASRVDGAGSASSDSLLHVLRDAKLEGEQVDLPTFAGLFVQIAIAGNELSRPMKSRSKPRLFK